MSTFRSLLALCIVVTFGSPAGADCTLDGITVSIAPSGTSSTCNITARTDGKYDIDLARSPTYTGNVLFTVAAPSNKRLGDIRADTNGATGGTTQLAVRGLTTGSKALSVDSIRKFGTAIPFYLLELRLSEDVGAGITSGDEAIRMDQINLADVRDVYWIVTVRSGAVVEFRCRNFYAHLNVDGGGINSLLCSNEFGDPTGSPIAVHLFGNIQFFRAATVHADFDTFHNGGTGTIYFLNVTGGDVKGSIHTRRIEAPLGTADRSLSWPGKSMPT